MNDFVPVRDPDFVPPHVPPELVWGKDLNAFARTFEDPFMAATELHKGPEIIWSKGATRGLPGWVPTRHALVQEIFLDAATFSSKHNTDVAELLGVEWGLTPFEIDPPNHIAYRQLLQPYFTPKGVDDLEGTIREIAVGLIEKFEDKGGCEFATEFADVLPSSVFLASMGMPRENLPEFAKWEHAFVRGTDTKERVEGIRKIKDYLQNYMEERRATPANDLTTFILNAEIKGRKLNMNEIMGISVNLYLGGLDTVLSSLGWYLLYLAKNPNLQTRLRENPGDIPAAVEDFARCYGVTTTRRYLSKDVEFHGVQMKKGDRVLMPTYISGRDASVFPNPETVDPDRKARHMTFGTGIHNCLGMHLAKRETKITLELFLERFKNIRIAPGKKEEWQSNGVWSVPYLPLVWD